VQRTGLPSRVPFHKTNLPELSFEETFHAVNLRSSRQPAFGFFLAIPFRLLLPPHIGG